MKIYVCDDEEEMAKLIAQEVENNLTISAEVSVFTNPIKMYETYETVKAEIIFLDIDMPGMDGIDIANKLRQSEDDVFIIFITNREEMVFQSIQYKPFRFIRKSMMNIEIREAMSALLKELLKTETELILEKAGKMYRLKYKDIIYVTSEKHNIHIICNNDVYTIRKKLSDIEEKLTTNMFIRTHVGYLVNPLYICSIGDKKIILDNNSEIPISRSRLEEVKEKYLNYTRSK